MIDFAKALEEYRMDQLTRWHFVKPPIIEGRGEYHPTKLERENKYCAVYSDSYAYERVVYLDTEETVTEDYYINNLYISYACRYVRIGDTTYDTLQPAQLMGIPIPEIYYGDIDSVPTWFLEQKGYTIDITSEIPEEDYDIFDEFWDDEENNNKISEILESLGEEAAIAEAYRLLEELCKQRGIEKSKKQIYEEVTEMIGIMTAVNEVKIEVEDPPKEEDKPTSNDLIEFLRHRVIDCFEPVLLLPLCYLTVNMKISQRGCFNCERIVAQLIAVGEDEYAYYLEKELSKMEPFWNPDESIAKGQDLREWAINSREYKWLKGNFPDKTPKSKGAYTSSKRKQTKRYLALKELANTQGYELIDNVSEHLQN